MMNIACVCRAAILFDLDDFGITYVQCSLCGREYEVVAEFSQMIADDPISNDLRETDYDGDGI